MLRVKGVDHVVLSVRDVNKALDFYHGLLGMEVLRLEEFRQGKVGFPSLRASAASIIDLQKAKGQLASNSSEGGNNVDHFCLLIEPTDIEALAAELQGKGVTIDGKPGRRWGAQGPGMSVYVRDPDGNKVELKCYQGTALDP